MADNPFDGAKGGVVMPDQGKVAIPATTEKAKTTNLPTIKVENKSALAGTHVVNPETDDVQEYIAIDPKKGLELTSIMTSQPNLDLAAEAGKNRAEILKQYGGLESNIPPNHPTYWNMR